MKATTLNPKPLTLKVQVASKLAVAQSNSRARGLRVRCQVMYTLGWAPPTSSGILGIHKDLNRITSNSCGH